MENIEIIAVNKPQIKKNYIQPEIVKIKMDNEISLVMQSAPVNPGESLDFSGIENPFK